MSSEDSLANTIGLTGYAVSGEGIGGVLKQELPISELKKFQLKLVWTLRAASPQQMSH